MRRAGLLLLPLLVIALSAWLVLVASASAAPRRVGLTITSDPNPSTDGQAVTVKDVPPTASIGGRFRSISPASSSGFT